MSSVRLACLPLVGALLFGLGCSSAESPSASSSSADSSLGVELWRTYHTDTDVELQAVDRRYQTLFQLVVGQSGSHVRVKLSYPAPGAIELDADGSVLSDTLPRDSASLAFLAAAVEELRLSIFDATRCHAYDEPGSLAADAVLVALADVAPGMLTKRGLDADFGARASALKLHVSCRAVTTLIAKSKCTACHTYDKWTVGPPFHDIAARYRGHLDQRDHLFQKVKLGSAGVWAQIPMLPNTNVRDQDIDTIVDWILSGPEIQDIDHSP